MTVDPSVQRLIDGVLVPGFVGTSPPDWLHRCLEDGLAGVCWFRHNVPDIETARSLADELHGVRGDALVLCDEEGGSVTRLEAATGSSWPGNAALGVVDDAAATEAAGVGVGAMASRAGIDVVLAPTVDVNSEPDNPVIGVRSFGADPALVARHSAAFVRGLQSTGVAACAKHFPGHGATRVDSHVGLPTVDADLDTVRRRDLTPFGAAVEAGVRCVLTAHVVYPALDSEPATMSAPWMSLLRDEVGFDGVVVSDALDMRAISRRVGRGPGAVAALRAGVDLICIGNPSFPERYDSVAVLDEVRRAVARAVADGWLPVERLQAAVDRIAALADWTSRRDRASSPPMPLPTVTGSSSGGQDAQSRRDVELGRELAHRAIRTDRVERLSEPPVVVVEHRTDLAAGMHSNWVVAALTARDPGAAAYEADAPVDLDEARKAWTADGGRPVVLVTDGVAGDALAQAIRAERPDAVVVHTGPAGAADSIGPPLLRSYGAGRVNADAVADVLMGPDRDR
ncbi:MAG TPA: glycoside hydrolase family 3 N-terminal domain-containing protein [Nocardioidaceae bacterium]|nr:glycoside hydrolase family 3 N-terminal domain-containing protein [Nocardioidaceae bacterium]